MESNVFSVMLGSNGDFQFVLKCMVVGTGQLMDLHFLWWYLVGGRTNSPMGEPITHTDLLVGIFELPESKRFAHPIFWFNGVEFIFPFQPPNEITNHPLIFEISVKFPNNGVHRVLLPTWR